VRVHLSTKIHFFGVMRVHLCTYIPQLCQQVATAHLEVSQGNVSTFEKLVTAHEGTQAGQLIKDFLSLSAKVKSHAH
jgi:hypothetical protein